MIRNKRFLLIAAILFVIVLVLNISYPNYYPFGETILLKLHLPTRIFENFHTIGNISTILLIVGLYLFAKSLNKYRIRLIILIIILLSILPSAIIGLYQSTFAKGIYTISYEQQAANCNFEMVKEQVLEGICALPMKNWSNKKVEFQLEFLDPWRTDNPEDPEMVTLMNYNGPYNVKLTRKESKTVYIKAKIDVSKMKNHIEGGDAQGINIRITSGGKVREL